MSEPVVAVIGAINVDLVVSGTPLPRPGETVTGGTFAQHDGGKGGNQATAAARAFDGHGRVVLIGAVGDDDLGFAAQAALHADGVDTSHVARSDGPTGVALIVVGPAGENQIAVAPGANATIEPERATDALAATEPDVVLMSLEIPRATAQACALWCAGADRPLLLNPAPIRPWAGELVPSAAWVTPNEHERAALGAAGIGAAVVIETRGAAGAIVRSRPPIAVEAPDADAVDTTGAGDCFNGVLAASLAEGLDVVAATRLAVRAAAISVATAGARTGMPRRDRIRGA